VNRTAPRRLALSQPVQMIGSLGTVALAGFVFLAFAGHLPLSREAAATTSLYVLANTVAQGVFVGLEQETSRTLAHTVATGAAVRPVLRQAGRHAAGLLALCLVVLAAGSPLLVSGPLHGEWQLLVPLLIGTVGAAAAYLVRGLLGGSQRFGGYAVTQLVEGSSRLIGCLGLAVLGVGSALAYCLVYSCGLLLAALVGLRWLRPLLASAEKPAEAPQERARSLSRLLSGLISAEKGTEAPQPGVRGLSRLVSGGLLLLVGASLLTQLVANLPALAASSRLADATDVAAAFVQAATLSRIPLLLTGPVSAMLIPRLTSADATGDLGALRKTVRFGVAAMLALGGVAAAGLAVLGPSVLGTLFNAHGISAASLVEMGVGTSALMAVSVLQPALVGMARQRWVPLAWGVGAAAMGLAVCWPGDPVSAAVAGSVVGPVAVIAVMGFGLARGLTPPTDATASAGLPGARSAQAALSNAAETTSSLGR
jgi:O-antigen/teichoic acid export membrane protein